MKPSVRSAAITLALLGVAACTTLYADPIGPNTVTLTVRNVSGSVLDFAFYEGGERCTDRRIVKDGIAPFETRTFRVLAGKEAAFTASQDLGMHPSVGGVTFVGCNPTISFTPDMGQQYIAVVGQEHGCSISLLRAPADATDLRAATPAPALKRQWRTPWDESGPFCEPKT
jgi:hypothetical protein